MSARTLTTIGAVAAIVAYLLWLLWPDPPATAENLAVAPHTTEPGTRRVAESPAPSTPRTDPFKEVPTLSESTQPDPEPDALCITVTDGQGRPRPNVGIIAFDAEAVLDYGATGPGGKVKLKAAPDPPRILLYTDDLMECEQLSSGRGDHDIALVGAHRLRGRVLMDGRIRKRKLLIHRVGYPRRAAGRILPPVGEHVLERVPEKEHRMVVLLDPSEFDFGAVSPYWQGELVFSQGLLLGGGTSHKNDWGKPPRMTLDCSRDYLVVDLIRAPTVTGRLVLSPSHEGLSRMRLRCIATVNKGRQTTTVTWTVGVDTKRRFMATLGDTAVTQLRFEVYDASKLLVGKSDTFAGPFHLSGNPDLGDVVIREE